MLSSRLFKASKFLPKMYLGAIIGSLASEDTSRTVSMLDISLAKIILVVCFRGCIPPCAEGAGFYTLSARLGDAVT